MGLCEKIGLVKAMHRKHGFRGWRNLLRNCAALMTEPDFVSSRPLMIQVEPTINCNLKCKMCISPFIKRDAKVMTLQRFNQILDQFPFVEKISLVGLGEPLLNPQLFDIIRAAKSRGIRIGFASNATLIDAAMAMKIKNSGVDWLNMSLDGATKETYEGIRIGANFDRVLENMRNLMAVVGAGPGPDVSIWHVLMRSNIFELEGLVSLVETLGIKKIFVQTAHCWGSEEWKNNTAAENIRHEMNLVKKALRGAYAAARNKKISFSYVNIPESGGARACQWPWRSCYITTDGFVTPCCIQGSDPTVVNFGNIFQESFETIWNNGMYRAFRTALKSRNIPRICVDCPSYYGKIKL